MSNVRLQAYKSIIGMSKEAVNKAMIPVRVMRAKKTGELELAKLDEVIARKEAEIHELCSKDNIDFHAIIAAQDRHALVERKKKALQGVMDQLFPK